jgi:2-phosphosulfolactate phosphatase
MSVMKFEYFENETCHTASGLVVVIDVIRAFSNAAYAFQSGAESIILVSGVEEALLLKATLPGSLAMGEVGGLPPAGFDFGNSPTEIVQQDLRGKHLIQRTGAGTQGAVRSVNAEQLFAASFAVAGATVRAIEKLSPPQISFVITGRDFGDEDLSCAEYIAACLQGTFPDPAPYLKRVHKSREAQLDALKIPSFNSDIDYCTRIDSCNFAMPIQRENNRPVMRALTPDT